MQNIDLICVGKLNAKYFAEGVAEYQKDCNTWFYGILLYKLLLVCK